MKLTTFILLIFLSIFFSASSNIKDCNEYDKLSTEYTKCTSELVKKKSIEIKNKTVSKLDKTKEKVNKFDLKKKFLKFKNSKSHKEFMEKLKNEN